MTTDAAGAVRSAPNSEGSPARFWRRFRRQKLPFIAACFLVLLILVAIFAPVLAPMDPDKQDLQNTLLGPGLSDHMLGTDQFGRDTLSRMLYATQVEVQAAGLAVATALVIGVVPGLIAGFFGGKVDAVIMRITDALMSFPPLILAMAIIGSLGPGLRNAMLAIGVVFAPTFLRIVRGSVLEVREETYIEASRSIGTPLHWIIRRHVLPNALPPLLVQISLAGAFSLLSEAALSFLGLGVQPPDSSWGKMLSQGVPYVQQQPWLLILPGIAVALAVLAFNMVGDGLRDSIGREVRR